MILPAAGAVLLTLALPPGPIPVLAVLGPAFLAHHLARLPDTPEGARGAVLAGMVFGGIHGALLLHWLPSAGRPLVGTMGAWTGAVAVWGLNAALLGLVLALVHRGVHRAGLPLPLALGAGWIALVWIPPAIPTAGFPWLGPEAALVDRPVLLGTADLVGGAGVAGLIVLLGGALGQVVARRDRRSLRDLTGALVVSGLAAGYGVVGEVERGSGVEGEAASGTLRAAALSLEADPFLLSDPVERSRRLPAALHRLTGELQPGEVDLVLWPESPTGTAGRGIETSLARLWAERLGRPIVFGILELEGQREAGRHPRPVNRIRVAWPGPGGGPAPWERGGTGDLLREKQRLVPVVEGDQKAGRGLAMARGPEAGPLAFPPSDGALASAEAPILIGALICFEALFPAEALALRARGTRVLLFPMNEGWLAGPGAGVGESARRQHEAVAAVRSVEARAPVLRSAVGGRAGGWDRGGRPLPAEERRVEGVGSVVLVDIPAARAGPPVAARGGVGAVGLLALLLLGAGHWGGRRTPVDGGTEA
jgi:apolipoprotein N-acyltransferase